MEIEDNKIWFWFFLLAVVVYFLIGTTRCTSVEKRIEVAPIETTIPSAIVNPLPIDIVLSWENTIEPHPERIPWSKLLTNEISLRFESLDKAKDMVKFCPKYSSLLRLQKVQAWGELFVWLAYYESGFDPKNASVDVGSYDSKSTWSTGLWQVSAIDWESYKLQKIIPYYSFEQLKTVEPNVKLALALMAQQIEKTGLILQPARKYLYWATLYPNGNYDESEKIIKKVKKLEFCK